MKQVKTYSELFRELEKLIPSSLEQIGKDIKEVLRFNLLTHWYKTYTPSFYDRTYMLLESLTVSKAKKVGKNYEVKIYFDPEKIIPVPTEKEGYFPAHMNITPDGASEYNGMTYGELLPIWIEEGQHSKIHSYLGIHMVRDTVEWAKQDNYIKNTMITILQSKGYMVAEGCS